MYNVINGLPFCFKVCIFQHNTAVIPPNMVILTMYSAVRKYTTPGKTSCETDRGNKARVESYTTSINGKSLLVHQVVVLWKVGALQGHHTLYMVAIYVCTLSACVYIVYEEWYKLGECSNTHSTFTHKGIHIYTCTHNACTCLHTQRTYAIAWYCSYCRMEYIC